jgi:hypothetical protein
MIRDIKLTLAVFMICYGLFLLNDFNKESEERSISKTKIIKIDEKTEIRITEGIKYRCIVVDK